MKTITKRSNMKLRKVIKTLEQNIPLVPSAYASDSEGIIVQSDDGPAVCHEISGTNGSMKEIKGHFYPCRVPKFIRHMFKKNKLKADMPKLLKKCVSRGMGNLFFNLESSEEGWIDARVYLESKTPGQIHVTKNIILCYEISH